MKRHLANIFLGWLESLTGFSTNPHERIRLRVRLYLLREYEPAVCRQIRQLVRPGMTVVDIGANIGYIVRELACAVGPAGRVLAFEPNPLVFPILQRNTRRYPQINILPIAIGARDGELKLRFSPDATGRASLFAVDATATETVAVKVRPLVQLLHESGISHVDLLKIDVEGAEFEALSTLVSAPELRPSNIIVEFNPACQRAAGHNAADFWKWFTDLGYTIQQIKETGLLPLNALAELEAASAALGEDQSLDLLATRRD